MGRTKSLITQVAIGTAKKAHDCQANSGHRLKKGDKRLEVRNGLGWDYYCWDCALKIFDKDIASLTELRNSK